MRAVILPLVLFCAIAPVPLRAQTGSAPRPGDRIRVEAGERDGVFQVVSVDADALVVLPGTGDPSIRLPLAAVRKLEVRRPRTPLQGSGRGFVIGGAAGAAAGVVLGLADGDDECAPGEWCFFEMSAGSKALVGGLAFGVAAGLVGAVIGAKAPGHRWEPIELPLEVELGASPAAGGVSVAVRFRVRSRADAARVYSSSSPPSSGPTAVVSGSTNR